MMYCMYIIIFCTLSHTYTRVGTPTKEGKVSDSVVERSRWWGATDWWPNDSVRRRRFWLIGVQLPLRDDPRDNNITGYFIFTTACIDPEGDKTIPSHGCKMLREMQRRVKIIDHGMQIYMFRMGLASIYHSVNGNRLYLCGFIFSFPINRRQVVWQVQCSSWWKSEIRFFGKIYVTAWRGFHQYYIIRTMREF